ncbi:unnamed protein product [Ostreobium quekettii]|uniref:Coenzyme Q-binding protein COQ10 START domain-containing protein n=1 Tax=Ostreobium quekettii TaxID=121088 RepID=A0A8S1J461_9CHLO|nr:unnamed protein product [Ostreobium quekettii]|eukprot:evm.model.scf_1326.2 EVM.evm.TU.scf_1326.2   scf_1326:12012-16392(+)
MKRAGALIWRLGGWIASSIPGEGRGRPAFAVSRLCSLWEFGAAHMRPMSAAAGWRAGGPAGTMAEGRVKGPTGAEGGALEGGWAGRRGIFAGPSDTARQHKERRLLGYSQKQLFKVVSSVEHYHKFVPWCVASRVITRKSPTYLEAELEVGFQLFVERYISKVVLECPTMVRTSTEASTLFHHLESVWEMKPGPTPNTCWLSFEVDFAFRSPLYRQVATVFFEEVVEHMISSFEGRCQVLYGPSSLSKNRDSNGSLQRVVA